MLDAEKSVGAPGPGTSVREWVLQDWQANAGRASSQRLLAWFRLAQWSYHRGRFGRLLVTPYQSLCSVVFGIEIPATVVIGPRLQLFHPRGIVINPTARLGADCIVRHGVTIGNTIDRAGRESPSATLGDAVELGVGCAVIGDLHVGDHARIGALAVVTKPVPAWGVAVGNPARVIKVDEPPLAAVPAAVVDPDPGTGRDAA